MEMGENKQSIHPVKNAPDKTINGQSVNGISTKFDWKYTNKDSANFNLNVDLFLPSNGITVIFGHSGSGKTTLLRCIAGLEKSQYGKCILNQETWQDDNLFVPTHKRSLGYVFQEASLFSHLTAQGNLQYAIKRADKAYSQDLYQQVIDLMGIGSILKKYPSQLSGGERQRVAIARALLIQPKLLLMDEPLASLDMARKQEILPYLEKLRSIFKIPIIYVTHSIDEAIRLADHVVVLQKGKVKTQGEVSEVLSEIELSTTSEKNMSVVWEGEIVKKDEAFALSLLQCSAGEMWLADNGYSIGDKLRIRILAKDVSLTLERHKDSSILNLLPSKIVEIIPQDNSAQVLVKLKVANHNLFAQLTRRSVNNLQLEEEQNVWAQVKSVAILT